MTFRCIPSDQLMDKIYASRKRNILICGIETHVCIQQSALDFIAKGFNVFIPIDATGSRKLIDHDTSIKRMSSSCIQITTTESAIFEWCKTADRGEFKLISSLVK